ncbi:MAG: carboxypeptidase regulatory-like domain-containing protein [Candidatus Thermoplasmatota archaeon]|nr:carboxypeptidase regulatory-like domain-containing protein [Candidatus Thermoplasmatota archaeon]
MTQKQTILVFSIILTAICIILMPFSQADQQKERSFFQSNQSTIDSFQFEFIPYTDGPITPGVETAEISGYHQFNGDPLPQKFPHILFWQYTTIEVIFKPDWATVTMPESTFLSHPDGRKNNFSIFVSVSENAPAYKSSPIQFRLTTGPFMRIFYNSISKEQTMIKEFSIQSGYLPLISIENPSVTEIPPDSFETIQLNITNTGNDKSRVDTTLFTEDIPNGWNVEPITHAIVDSGETNSIQIGVYTPKEYDFIDEWVSLPLTLQVTHPHSSVSEMSNYSINILVHCYSQLEPTEKHNITICGYVLDNETNTSIPEANLQTYNPNPLTIHDKTTTDNTGFYSFNITATKETLLIARAPEYYTKFDEISELDQSLVWINFSLVSGQMPETSTICGYIIDNHSMNPIPNATIMIYQPIYHKNNYQIDLNLTHSNEEGYFECNAKFGYAMIFAIDAEGYIPYETNYNTWDEVNFWLDWNETEWKNHSLDKMPKESSIIHGYITNEETGEPLNNATVRTKSHTLFDMKFYNQTKTDENGYFSIHVPAGNITLSIVHQNYHPEDKFMVIDYHETKMINRSLDPIVIENDTYQYSWIQNTETQCISSNLFSGDELPYYENISLILDGTYVIDSVEIMLNWTDDHTYGLLNNKGLDELNAKIQYNSQTFSEVSTGNGNLTFSYQINNRPNANTVEAKTITEAEHLVNQLIKGQNKATFNVEITVDPGERRYRILHYLLDYGNQFELTLKYSYYEYELSME